MLSLYQIEEAYKRISKFINKTPLINSDKLDKLTKSKIVIKAECLQKTGSFKIRGAINMISQIASDKVVAPSSGNHAQGVAAAAKIFNKSATLVMPEDAPRSKISGVKFYDGKIVFYDRYKEHRMEIAKEIAKNSRVNVFLIKNENQLAKYIKQNIFGEEIIIGMGAGSISNWIRKLPYAM